MIFSNKGKKTWQTGDGFNDNGTRFFDQGSQFRGGGKTFWGVSSFGDAMRLIGMNEDDDDF